MIQRRRKQTFTGFKLVKSGSAYDIKKFLQFEPLMWKSVKPVVQKQLS
jgi:hypothetical protein